jgi:hypothetical protein
LWVDRNKKGGRNITSTPKDEKEKRKRKSIQGVDNSTLQLSDTTDWDDTEKQINN